jgi:hypothetical protein
MGRPEFSRGSFARSAEERQAKDLNATKEFARAAAYSGRTSMLDAPQSSVFLPVPAVLLPEMGLHSTARSPNPRSKTLSASRSRCQPAVGQPA